MNALATSKSLLAKTIRADSNLYTEGGSPKTGISNSPKRLATDSFVNGETPVYHNISASTLQFTCLTYKFAKSNRFPVLKSQGSADFCNSPSSLGSKAPTFGIGPRPSINTNKDAETFPAPTRYHLKSDFSKNHKRGKSFGIGYSYYEKVYIPENKIIPTSVLKEVPGPGAYYNNGDVTGHMNRFTLGPKGKMFNEKLYICSPKCNQYNPKESITSPSRFKETTFGFGQKYDFTKETGSNPGPGTYTLPSFTDKCKKKKKRMVSMSMSRSQMPRLHTAAN